LQASITATAKNCPRLVGKSYRKIAVASKVVRPAGTFWCENKIFPTQLSEIHQSFHFSSYTPFQEVSSLKPLL